jgi:hypothetical protein
VLGSGELLSGDYPVGAVDFDLNGHVDLLVDDGAVRKVVFFTDSGAVDPAVPLGPASLGDWPIVDTNADGFADVLVPTSARDGIGAFLGASDRTFFPQFQSSILLPEGTQRLILLPPTGYEDPLTEESVEPAALRSLTQLGALIVEEDDSIRLCRIFSGAQCMPIPLGSVDKVDLSNPPTALVTSPFFVTPTGGESAKFLISVADDGGDQLFRIELPTDSPTPDVVEAEFYPWAYAEPPSTDCALELCDPASMCSNCVLVTGVAIEALSNLDRPDLQPYTLIAGTYLTPVVNERRLMVFLMNPFDPFARAFPLLDATNTVVLDPDLELADVQFAELNGGGTPEIVLTYAESVGDVDLYTTEILVIEPAPARVIGPRSRVAVGDLNADGYDDVVGLEGFTSASNAAGIILYGGDSLPLVTTNFDVGGLDPTFTLADLDGDGVRDLVTSSVVDPGENLSEIAVSFGRPFAAPEPPRSLGRSTISNVFPARLQVRSGPDDDAPSSDGIEDLVIVKAGGFASLLVGDRARLPTSPLYLNGLLRQRLGATMGEFVGLGSTLSLGAATPTTPPIVALLNVVVAESEESFESWLVPLASADGILSVPKLSVQVPDDELVFSELVAMDAQTFAVLGLNVSTGVESSVHAVRVGEDELDLKGSLAAPFETNLLLPGRPEQGSVLLFSTDGSANARLLELVVEGDALVVRKEVAIDSYVPVAQRLGPDALQLGETVISLSATLEDQDLVVEPCVRPVGVEAFLFGGRVSADLVGDPLLDVVGSYPPDFSAAAGALLRAG